MATKRKFKQHSYKPRLYYGYVNPDGSRYWPDGYESTEEIPEEEVPEEIDIFEFGIRIQSASFNINSSNSLASAVMKAQMRIQMDERTQADLEIEENTRQGMLDFIASISQWNRVDKQGSPLPITLDTVAELEPAWLYLLMREVYDSLNSLGKKNQGTAKGLRPGSNTGKVPEIRSDNHATISELSSE